ncbi:MAG: hypothetical protein CM15mV68_310 [uncultured marine virus]|nr:MAG: hypothetical protein CM15mV68_310 [uncultured marine virus]
MIMCNLTDAGEEVHRYHVSLSSTGASSFRNFGDNYVSTANITNSTAPSSSVITLGDVDTTNKNSSEHIIYAFAEKRGFLV